MKIEKNIFQRKNIFLVSVMNYEYIRKLGILRLFLDIRAQRGGSRNLFFLLGFCQHLFYVIIFLGKKDLGYLHIKVIISLIQK